jgi:hypothetical protein
MVPLEFGLKRKGRGPCICFVIRILQTKGALRRNVAIFSLSLPHFLVTFLQVKLKVPKVRIARLKKADALCGKVWALMREIDVLQAEYRRLRNPWQEAA